MERQAPPNDTTPPTTPKGYPESDSDASQSTSADLNKCLIPFITINSILTPPSSVDAIDRENLLESEDELPDEPYYDYKFQKAIQRASDVANDIEKTLEGCPVSESTIEKLRKEASRWSKHKLPVSRTIGVIGHSGQGKSSLINSLLDVEDLAITGDNGQAVTAFVIEYKNKPESQSSKLLIEAYCLTTEDINEHLAELLDNYRAPYIIPPEELTAEQYRVAEERSEVARYIFEAAFSRFGGFDIELLISQSLEASLSSLRGHAKQFKWPNSMKDGMWTGSADTSEECHELMSPFLTEGLWPFIKSMSIYLDALVLRSGVVLADLPGYHDVNFARVRAAQRYQSTCDELFVVADIKRAIDNPIIKDVIQNHKRGADGIGEVRCPNITVVCTHSADVSLSIKNLAKTKDEDKTRKAMADINRIKGQRFETCSAGVEALEEAKLALKSIYIQRRNEHVKMTLQNTYAAAFSNGTLPVFCVDNAMYQDKASSQTLSISGIPILRRHTLSLPGKSLFRAANLYLNTHLPALVASLQIWLEAGQSSESFSVSGDLDQEEWFSEFDHHLSDLKTTILKTYKRAIKGPLAEDQRQVTAEALQTCNNWKGMHHSSFRAFLNHNGTHSTPAVGFKCWNTELVENLNAVVAYQWPALGTLAVTQLQELCTFAIEEFNRMKTELEDSSAPKSFIHSFVHRENQVKEILYLAAEIFVGNLRIINQQATSGNPGSYVLDYMRAVYSECQRDSGTGVTARNHDRLQDHVRRPEFITHQVRWAFDALQEIVDQMIDRVYEEVSSIVSAIKADLKRIESPSRTLMRRYPHYVERVEETLEESKRKMRENERMVEGARREARLRGYIS